MTTLECTREREVLDAVHSGRWPDRCGDELEGHVRACAVCADVALLAARLQDERDRLWQRARVPSPAHVWWRATLRARQEAAVASAQPMMLVHGFAGICVGAVAVAALAVLWPALWRSVFLLRTLIGPVDLDRLEPGRLAGVLAGIGVPLGLALGAWLVLAPVALYFVLRDEG